MRSSAGRLAFVCIALLAPVSASAATVTLTKDTSVVLPSTGAVYTLSSGGTFDKIVVSNGSMTFTMSAGETVTITAPGNNTLTNDGGFTPACATHSTLTLNPSSSKVITVTPGSSCTASSSNGSSSQSSSNGSISPVFAGGETAPNPLPLSSTDTQTAASSTSSASPNAALTVPQINSLLGLLAAFNASQSVIANVRAILTRTNSPSATPQKTFLRNLFFGITGTDVRALQVYLNTHGARIASSGAGSPGDETTYFGTLTKDALARFQAAHNIYPPAGYFGPLTRSYLASHP